MPIGKFDTSHFKEDDMFGDMLQIILHHYQFLSTQKERESFVFFVKKIFLV